MNKYITQVRMDVAEILLKKGNLSSTAIAEQLGYESYSYFSTTF